MLPCISQAHLSVGLGEGGTIKQPATFHLEFHCPLAPEMSRELRPGECPANGRAMPAPIGCQSSVVMGWDTFTMRRLFPHLCPSHELCGSIGLDSARLIYGWHVCQLAFTVPGRWQKRLTPRDMGMGFTKLPLTPTCAHFADLAASIGFNPADFHGWHVCQYFFCPRLDYHTIPAYREGRSFPNGACLRLVAVCMAVFSGDFTLHQRCSCVGTQASTQLAEHCCLGHTTTAPLAELWHGFDNLHSSKNRAPVDGCSLETCCAGSELPILMYRRTAAAPWPLELSSKCPQVTRHSPDFWRVFTRGEVSTGLLRKLQYTQPLTRFELVLNAISGILDTASPGAAYALTQGCSRSTN